MVPNVKENKELELGIGLNFCLFVVTVYIACDPLKTDKFV